jgi:epoxyqueuosine reductase
VESDFKSLNQLDTSDLASLFLWSEEEFLRRFEGSSIRRIGYQNWLRNIAVALGNAERTVANLKALRTRENHPDARVNEHIHWAIEQQL